MAKEAGAPQQGRAPSPAPNRVNNQSQSRAKPRRNSNSWNQRPSQPGQDSGGPQSQFQRPDTNRGPPPQPPQIREYYNREQDQNSDRSYRSFRTDKSKGILNVQTHGVVTPQYIMILSGSHAQMKVITGHQDKIMGHPQPVLAQAMVVVRRPLIKIGTRITVHAGDSGQTEEVVFTAGGQVAIQTIMNSHAVMCVTSQVVVTLIITRMIGPQVPGTRSQLKV